MRLKYLLFLLISITALSFAGCKDDDIVPEEEEPGNGTEWTIPTYADDYSPIASWSQRNQWNLANVHDPSVAYYNGYYYMYCTDASYGNAHEGHGHFQGKRSTDLVNWEWVGGPFYDAPAWVADSLNAIRSRMGLDAIAKDNINYGYWAPVVRRVNVGGQEILRMYYSVVIDNYIKTGKANTTTNFDGSWTERAFIGMCESTDPAGAVWTDKGFVTTSSSDRGKNYSRSGLSDWDAYFYYNAIDPTYIVTPEGKHYLIYGSWHSGFALLEVDATTGKPLNTLGEPYANSASELTARYGERIGTRSASSRWQGSEAPEIIYKDGYYYLFLAYDELSVAYNTRVCRSRNITGPYEGYDGKNITAGGECFPLLTHPYRFNGHSGWVGISHCCVFEDGNGNWFYASQGRLPENTGGNAYSNAIMMGHIRSMRWTDDGWPVVMPERYGCVPQTPISTSELIADWEHIELNYQYKTQQVSKNVTLHADNTVSGAMSGTWSFDETNRILQINSQKLYVAREVDWEASPRRATLVYAGLSPAGISLWGKKSD